MPGGKGPGMEGAVADPGLVIGAGHGRGLGRVHGLPDGARVFGEKAPIFLFR